MHPRPWWPLPALLETQNNFETTLRNFEKTLRHFEITLRKLRNNFDYETTLKQVGDNYETTLNKCAPYTVVALASPPENKNHIASLLPR